LLFFQSSTNNLRGPNLEVSESEADDEESEELNEAAAILGLDDCYQEQRRSSRIASQKPVNYSFEDDENDLPQPSRKKRYPFSILKQNFLEGFYILNFVFEKIKQKQLVFFQKVFF